MPQHLQKVFPGNAKDMPKLIDQLQKQSRDLYADLSNTEVATGTNAQAITTVNETINQIINGDGVIVLPIVHPEDSTTGIFPITNPIGVQFKVAGIVVAQMTGQGFKTF